MESTARMGNNIFPKDLTLLALLFIITSAAEASRRTSLINRYLAASGAVFNVEKYGADGDGTSDSTKAFRQAWSATCKESSATLLVPESKTFLVNNIVFEGPCQPGFIFQVDGTIVAPPDPNSWQSNEYWLLFEHLQQFTLSGKGTIDGQGKKWWENTCKKSDGKSNCNDDDRPTAIHFNDVDGIVIKGLKATNSPLFHMTFSNSDNVQILGVQISAPDDSPNTDGIDLFSSKNILIQDTIIGSGDDCVAIGDGSSDIAVKGLTCGPGHGISIGSLGKGNTAANVHSVQVDGAKLDGTTNGLRIKTWQGGSGIANNIQYRNVEMVNVENPIIIDQYYCDSATKCKNSSSAVQISDVTYTNIHGTSATEAAITLTCSQSKPCTGIKLSDVQLTLPSGQTASSVCEHAQTENLGSATPLNCKGN